MPDMTAIAAALSALKGAKDVAEAMIGLRDTAAFQGKLLEFQSKLIDANNAAFAAQDERSAMLDRIRKLEQEVTNFKAWETRKEKYELKNVAWGAVAYMLKPETRGSEPPHWLCTQCFENQKASIMQPAPRLAETSLSNAPVVLTISRRTAQSRPGLTDPQRKRLSGEFVSIALRMLLQPRRMAKQEQAIDVHRVSSARCMRLIYLDNPCTPSR
jgi:hypothetical protein